MEALKSANLGLRLLLELAALAALGYWGFHTGKAMWVRWVLALGAPILAAVLWVTFVAPESWIAVSEPVRLGVEVVVFGAAVAGLARSGRITLAVVLAALVLINRTLMLVWDQ